MIVDLGHNPVTHPRLSTFLSTLTRTGLRWSIDYERPLLPRERLGAMGIALPCLCGSGYHDILESQFQLSKHFENISDAACVSFSGNGMHIPTAEAILVWVLGHVAPRFGIPRGMVVVGFHDDDDDAAEVATPQHDLPDGVLLRVEVLPQATASRLARVLKRKASQG
jgi:hypothetical protein